MTNKKLRADLLAELEVSPQRLNQRVQELKRRCPMSTEDATYCIAHLEGLKLDKYLPQQAVDRVRELLPHVSPSGDGTSGGRRTVKTVVKTRELKIGGAIEIRDPILSEKLLGEAREMAGKIYPMLYVFENSVREVVQRVMTKKFGSAWWGASTVPTGIRNQVAERKTNEEKEAWHGKRGAHEICYTNIDDLVAIVQKNWPSFKAVFPRQDWFANIIRCMEMSRNTVAHMNPLPKEDVQRVRLNLGDWQRQIGARKHLMS